jgi:tetratricopeptide (TPR) repeat protein
MECPECGEINSEVAYNCIKCNHQFREKPSELIKRSYLTIAVIFIAAVMFISQYASIRELFLSWVADRYFYADKFDRSIELYTKLMDLNGSNAEYPGQRGRAFAEKKMYRQAADDLSRAIDLNPQESKLRYERGQIYIRMGMTKEGMIDMKYAADRDYEKAYFYLLLKSPL